MLPAPTLKTILEGEGGRSQSAGRRLVSVLLATPDTAPFASLRNNVAYFNARTGAGWDLHVAGYYAYGGSGYDPAGFPVGIYLPVRFRTGLDPGPEWWFSPKHFARLRRELEEEHKKHTAMQSFIRRRTAWTYSGTPEIVSMWATGAAADWDSLVAHRLTEAEPLGHAVEIHADWSQGQLPVGFRPGTRPHVVAETLHADTLRRGLSWVIAGASGAALSEGVNILVDELTRRH